MMADNYPVRDKLLRLSSIIGVFLAAGVIAAAFVVSGLIWLLWTSSAHAETGCRSLADVYKVIEANGGAHRPLTMREFDFARGLYVAQPNTPVLMPEGDSGIWVTGGEHILVMFTRRGEACEVMAVGPDGLLNFEQLGKIAGDPS